MRINPKSKGVAKSTNSSANKENVFDIFKNDLINEWVIDKKDISELDENWMAEVSGKGKTKRKGRVIPFNSPFDDDNFLFVA